ncbi:D-serine ammonia-lyase [Pseudomonas sp. NFACC02]|uniref:D-serine ammonia-lyase n=1 Tax=Pseudomonas sp. NFACC02 TaxID=1566250 RepID=UPI0008D7AF47|nr:D-serine ammonia-lyase [Pseudomonas sp. NFACC02]SEQ89437.1 D-serine ammonia-lyase [Pseudomonas sp. NFACC02]
MITSVYAKDLNTWKREFPLMASLLALDPVTWFNPGIAPLETALGDIELGASDVADASARLQRFASFLAHAFPEVAASDGIIESELVAVPEFAQALCERYGVDQSVTLLLKKDSHLPISGSVKARGGIYEVLFHAEQLAIRHGLLTIDDDYRKLAEPQCRALFGAHKIAVGSTGNLGMSIGIAGARLGFATTVHMSADARQWKKDKLRAHGVTVIEYAGDYGKAVEQGRKEAEADPACHFIDDENSTTLFLGYSVAGERLKAQFEQRGITVDAAHPLFVYLPCGVGGGPGGIAFGLKLAFGDHVHCIFAEPIQSPCMLMGVYTGLHDSLAVQDFGISNLTAADGLAVGRPSGFVGRSMQRMLDGYYTLGDDEMFALLYLMQSTQGIALEPSALAGAPGFARVLLEQQGYRQRMGFSPQVMNNATHLIWATGGGMVPVAEMDTYIATGHACVAAG